MKTSSQFRASDPHRKPDWRWRQALAVMQSDHAEAADEYVREAARYLKTHHEEAAGYGSSQTWQKLTCVAESHDLHNSHSWLQLEIEARLLAGQGASEISALTGAREDTVVLYEALFFNVQDRLQAHGYVWCQFLSPSVVVCGGEAFIRGVAYFGGIVALEAILTVLKTNNSTTNQPADFATPSGRLAELVSLALYVDALPSTANGTAELLRAMPTILEALGRTSATTTEPISDGLPVTVPPTALQGSLNRLDELTWNTAEEQPVADVNAA